MYIPKKIEVKEAGKYIPQKVEINGARKYEPGMPDKGISKYEPAPVEYTSGQRKNIVEIEYKNPKTYKPNYTESIENGVKNYNPDVIENKSLKTYKPEAIEGNTGKIYKPEAIEGNTGKIYTPESIDSKTGKIYKPEIETETNINPKYYKPEININNNIGRSPGISIEINHNAKYYKPEMPQHRPGSYTPGQLNFNGAGNYLPPTTNADSPSFYKPNYF